MCLDERGDLYVSTADQVVRVSGPDFRHSEVLATLPGTAGALEAGPDGLLVGVAGTGLMRLGRDGTAELVTAADESGVPIHCPTDVALAGDGTIYLTDGSSRHHGRDWVRDLMEQNACGRLLRHGPVAPLCWPADWPTPAECP